MKKIERKRKREKKIDDFEINETLFLSRLVFGDPKLDEKASSQKQRARLTKTSLPNLNKSCFILFLLAEI